MIENFRMRVFRSVAHHLNFSRAAEELFLSQPAVTQQVKALEDELGVSLFDRGGGKIRLTPGGATLLPFAESLHEMAASAIAAVALAYGEQAGELSLGASQTIGQYLLPGIIAGFLELHPRVRISACSGNTDAMLEKVLARDVHLAMIEGPELRKDLHIEPFMEDQMVCVVPSSHGWADQDIEAKALRGEEILMREYGSGSRRVIEQALSSTGLKARDLRIRMEFDSTEGLLSGVEAGLGIAFVSRWAIRNRLSLGTFKIAHIRNLRLSRSFSLVYPSGPEPGGNIGAFRRFLLTFGAEAAFPGNVAGRKG